MTDGSIANQLDLPVPNGLQVNDSCVEAVRTKCFQPARSLAQPRRLSFQENRRTNGNFKMQITLLINLT